MANKAIIYFMIAVREPSVFAPIKTRFGRTIIPLPLCDR
tara:strand:+ start:1620 stop:1736 length:117 start_codon:yes stop_codon:yes gene_type:complete